jgi:hypothetical protein
MTIRPLLVEMADVAGRQPAVLSTARSPRVAPIAVHHQLAADHDLAVLGDAHLGVLERRADRFHRMPALGRLQLITGPASVWP